MWGVLQELTLKEVSLHPASLKAWFFVQVVWLWCRKRKNQSRCKVGLVTFKSFWGGQQCHGIFGTNNHLFWYVVCRIFFLWLNSPLHSSPFQLSWYCPFFYFWLCVKFVSYGCVLLLERQVRVVVLVCTMDHGSLMKSQAFVILGALVWAHLAPSLEVTNAPMGQVSWAAFWSFYIDVIFVLIVWPRLDVLFEKNCFLYEFRFSLLIRFLFSSLSCPRFIAWTFG